MSPIFPRQAERVISSGRTISPGGYVTVYKYFTTSDMLNAADRRP